MNGTGRVPLSLSDDSFCSVQPRIAYSQPFTWFVPDGERKEPVLYTYVWKKFAYFSIGSDLVVGSRSWDIFLPRSESHTHELQSLPSLHTHTPPPQTSVPLTLLACTTTNNLLASPTSGKCHDVCTINNAGSLRLKLPSYA